MRQLPAIPVKTSPGLLLVSDGKQVRSSSGPDPRKRWLRVWRLTALWLIFVSGLVLGALGGWTRAWDLATDPLVIAKPVFVRALPAACILDGWATGPRESVPFGAIATLVMRDPARDRGWAACWPLWHVEG
jgi:hypothetical protein